jgi:hypothetical protein
MISRDDFYKNRDLEYSSDWTNEIELQAQVTIKRANQLLVAFGDENRVVTSGWRPPEVNANIPGAAKFSRHMTGQAIDIEDHEGDLDEWCLAHPEVLVTLGLWQEHPAATKGWCHLQTVPPKSGNRVFYP